MSEQLVFRSYELVQLNQRLLTETRLYIALSRRICIGWLGIRGGANLLTPRDPENAPWPLDELQGLVREKLGRGKLFLLAQPQTLGEPSKWTPLPDLLAGYLQGQRVHGSRLARLCLHPHALSSPMAARIREASRRTCGHREGIADWTSRKGLRGDRSLCHSLRRKRERHRHPLPGTQAVTLLVFALPLHAIKSRSAAVF